MVTSVSLNNPTTFDTGNVANLTNTPAATPTAKAQVMAFRDQLKSGALGGTPEFQAFLGNYLDNVIQSGSLDRGSDVYRSSVAPSINAERQSKGLKPLSLDQIPLARDQGSDNRRINQLAYQNVTLGANGRTISAAGCMLASVTMATNTVNNNNLSIVESNNLLQRNGALSADGNMKFDEAVRSLGARTISQSSHPDQMQVIAGQQQQNPNNTRLILGVNSLSGRAQTASGAGHFMTGTVDADGTIRAIDPAGGRDVTFTLGSDGYYHAPGHTVLEMRMLGSADPSLAVNRSIKA